MNDTTQKHTIVSEQEWLEARKKLLAKEKQFTRLQDELNQERRNLPWVKVEKPYVFDGPNGKKPGLPPRRGYAICLSP